MSNANDLIMKYQFTDRAGREVFNLTTSTTVNPRILAQIRMKHGVDSGQPNGPFVIDWNETVKTEDEI